MQEINSSPSPVKSSGDKPLSLRTKLVFGFGDWGNSSTSTIFGFFFAFFLNNIAGVQPIYAIPVLLAGGIWDAINDPLIGVFADRVRTRWGRRRPFFLFGAIPFGLSFILLWWVPPFDSQAALSVYYSLVYIMFDTAYTFVAVPYSALTPELTGDYNERTSLNGYRMVVSVIAGLVAAVAMPFFVEQVADKQAAYLAVAAVFGILAIIPYLLLFFFIKERFQNVESAKFSIFKGFQLTWRNKPFRYAAGIYTTAWVSVSLAGALFQYYLTFWLRIPTQVDVILGLLMVSTLVFIPLIVYLSKRLGKQKAYMIALGWWAVVMISLFLLPPYFTPVIYFLIAGAGIGVAAAHVIPASMIPDVIDQDELDTGFHREATYYGFIVFIQKAGSAALLAFMQLALSISGYRIPISPSDPLSTLQPESTLWTIRFLIGPVCAALLGGSILLAWKYPITRESHTELRKAIVIQRAEGEQPLD